MNKAMSAAAGAATPCTLPVSVETAACAKPNLIIFDLDGVLNLLSYKGHVDWDDEEHCRRLFESHTPRWPVITLLKALYQRNAAQGVLIAICTGRPDRYRKETAAWLRTLAVPYHDLFMRPDGCTLSDAEMKRNVLNFVRKSHNVWFVVEDRPSVVAMWREEGVTCLQLDGMED